MVDSLTGQSRHENRLRSRSNKSKYSRVTYYISYVSFKENKGWFFLVFWVFFLFTWLTSKWRKPGNENYSYF